MSRRATQAYDYRNGVVCAKGVPRACQPREGGPPLLFMTDIRMTILVHLALAQGTVRPAWLWKHMGKSAKTALRPLVEFGLVAKWKYGGKTFVALDPCHPAAQELRELLVQIGAQYRFKPMGMDVDAREGGAPLWRPRRHRDVRFTFGDHRRTLLLLLTYIRTDLCSADAARIVPKSERSNLRGLLYMFRAFGLMKSRRFVVNKRRGEAFSFDVTNPLVLLLIKVLARLDQVMPLWRHVANRQLDAPIPTAWRHREGRLIPKFRTN